MCRKIRLDYPGLLAFSPGERYLAYTGGLYNFLSRSAHVLELPGGRMLFDQKFQVSIHGLAIDPEERLLGVAGGDTVVRLYDFTRGSPEPAYANTYDDGSAFARCEPVIGKAAHAPPRDLVTRTAQDGRARFFLGHEERVLGISFAPTGALFTTGPDGLVRQWISNTGNTAVPAVRIGHMESTYQREQPAASVDGAHLLYLVGSTTLHCDVGASSASGHEVVTTVGKRHAPLAVLRDGRPITLARDGSVVVLWEKIDGKFREQRSFRDPSARLPRVGRPRRGVLSHDETRLAGALPGQLFTVDLVSGRMEVSGDFGQRTGSLGVASHDLSPDGNWIASSGFGVRISIHRFEEPGEIVAFVGGEKRGFDTAAAFGRNGRLLYTGNEDGRVRVWNTKTWTEIPELGFAAHRGAISAITVSHDGTLLATSGASTLKLFPIAPEAGVSYRRERISFEIDQPANWIQFARGADGRDTALLHSSPARTLEVWNAGPGERDRMTSDFVPEEAGDLPRPLAHHGMVALSDGRVLVAGGEGTTRNELPVCRSECFLYDPASNAWSRTGSLRSPRSRRLNPILLGDGKVLVAGGMGTENHPLASCELYDPKREMAGDGTDARFALQRRLGSPAGRQGARDRRRHHRRGCPRHM